MGKHIFFPLMHFFQFEEIPFFYRSYLKLAPGLQGCTFVYLVNLVCAVINDTSKVIKQGDKMQPRQKNSRNTICAAEINDIKASCKTVFKTKKKNIRKSR